MADITCIIPVYNEDVSVVERTIKELREGFGSYDYEIIVVDDGSKHDYSGLGVKVIKHKINRGYGAAIKTGLLNTSSRWILITDADGTYPNKEVGKLIKYMDKADMIVGARKPVKGAVPATKGFAKFILRIIAWIVTGTWVPDLNSGFRLFEREMAMKYFDLYPNGFSFTSTITVGSLSDNYAVKYVPVPYYKRIGKSYIKPRDFLNFISLIFRMLTYFKPLKLFLPVSFLLMAVGIIKAIIDYSAQGHFGLGGVMAFLVGFQIMFLGIVADIVKGRK